MSTKLTTGKCRFSYANVWEPKVPQSGGDAEYSLTLLIPKSDTDTLNKIQAAMKEAADNFRAKNGANSLPAKPMTTLHDGDGMKPNGGAYEPECKGHMVISVKSKNRPIIIDASKNEILDRGAVYSGCYGRASINFYAYNTAGRKGISAGLLGLQKLADGEAIGMNIGTIDDFDEVADDDFPW